MSVPNDYPTVLNLESRGYFRMAQQGSRQACGYFARLVAYTLNPSGDPTSWGWLSKNSGETQVEGFAEDSIVYGNDPAHFLNVVDLIVGAGAPGARTGWAVKERRPGNEWRAPQPLSTAQFAVLLGTPEPPGESPRPPTTPPAVVCRFTETDLSSVLAAIQRLQGEMEEVQRQSLQILSAIHRAESEAINARLVAADARLTLSNGLALEGDVGGKRLTGVARG
jgi:hypothetical protein